MIHFDNLAQERARETASRSEILTKKTNRTPRVGIRWQPSRGHIDFREPFSERWDNPVLHLAYCSYPTCPPNHKFPGGGKVKKKAPTYDFSWLRFCANQTRFGWPRSHCMLKSVTATKDWGWSVLHFSLCEWEGRGTESRSLVKRFIILPLWLKSHPEKMNDLSVRNLFQSWNRSSGLNGDSLWGYYLQECGHRLSVRGAKNPV